MEGSDFLLAGVLFLFAAVAAVPLASRLGIGAVLGYLLAGIAIGPWGLGFISDVDEIDQLVVMANGHVMAQGTPEEVMTPGLLRTVFSVEAEIHPEPVSGRPMCLMR